MLGVVHLLPLPGSPSYAGEPLSAIYDRALADARAYAEAGFDGLIVENHGDVPFLKPELLGPETAAVMAVAAERVRREVGLPDRHQRPGERGARTPSRSRAPRVRRSSA